MIFLEKNKFWIEKIHLINYISRKGKGFKLKIKIKFNEKGSIFLNKILYNPNTKNS